MPVLRTPLEDKTQTGRAMYSLVERFHGDIGAWATRPLPEWFAKVRSIPYRKDARGAETVARPALLLSEFPHLDCKKKAILIAAWLRANGIGYRFIAASEKPDGRIHHVFPQGKFAGRWRNLDATYPDYRYMAPKPTVTRAQELTR